jgi:hypothetical protein
MDKIDFKKKHKSIYGPSAKTPQIVDVPNFQYAVLSGVGNPNTSEDFSNSISALYGLSYTISMSYKGDFIIPDFYSYVVPPLEGVWDVVDGKGFKITNKDNLKWKIGLMQPEFVTQEVFNEAKSRAFAKKKNDLTNNLKLESYCDGLSCTFMHKGSFDDEKQSFDMMEAFCAEQGYQRIEKTHREIYLSNFEKTKPENLKTVLRFKVKKV